MNAIPGIEETSDGRRLGISENAVPKNKRDTCDERRFLKRAMNAVIYSDKHCTKNTTINQHQSGITAAIGAIGPCQSTRRNCAELLIPT